MNNNNWKQLKAVLMTYYTRPLMWVMPLALLYMFIFNHRYNHSFWNDYGIRIVALLAASILVLFHLYSQFSLPQSRILPQFRKKHLLSAAVILVLILFCFHLPKSSRNFSWYQSFGIGLGVLCFYSSCLINRNFFKRSYTTYSYLLALLPFLLFLTNINDQWNQTLSGLLVQYSISSRLIPFFLISAGAYVLFLVGKQTSSLGTYEDIKVSRINFNSYKEFMGSLTRNPKTKQTFLGFSVEQDLSKAIHLDKTKLRERLQLWSYGNISLIFPHIKFGLIICSVFLMPLFSNNFSGNNHRILYLLFLLMSLHTYIAIIPWSQRMARFSNEFIKPVGNRTIVSDYFLIYCKNILVILLVDFILLTVLIHWFDPKISANNSLLISFVYISFMLFEASVAIYYVQKPLALFFASYFSSFIFIIIVLTNNIDYLIENAIYFSFTLIVLSAVAAYIAYHHWQNMEWGAKG
jgi:hypothetical protein